jgi:hypothetical protein
MAKKTQRKDSSEETWEDCLKEFEHFTTTFLSKAEGQKWLKVAKKAGLQDSAQLVLWNEWQRNPEMLQTLRNELVHKLAKVDLKTKNLRKHLDEELNGLQKQQLHMVKLRGNLGVHEHLPDNLEINIASVLAYLLPNETAEEWLGDLREAIVIMIRAGRPRWVRVAITIRHIGVLLWALLRVKITDLIAKQPERS